MLSLLLSLTILLSILSQNGQILASATTTTSRQRHFQTDTPTINNKNDEATPNGTLFLVDRIQASSFYVSLHPKAVAYDECRAAERSSTGISQHSAASSSAFSGLAPMIVGPLTLLLTMGYIWILKMMCDTARVWLHVRQHLQYF